MEKMPRKWWRKLMWLLFAVHYKLPCDHKWVKVQEMQYTSTITCKPTGEYVVMVCWKCGSSKNLHLWGINPNE